MAEVDKWVKFLLPMDQRAKARGAEWVRPVAELLVKNDMLEAEDLCDTNPRELKGASDLGEVKLAMLQRVVNKVTETENAKSVVTAPTGASACDVASELAKVLGKPEKEEKVIVDVGPGLSTVSLTGLDADFWPRPTAVNSLATEGAKLKKQGVAQPYVFADLRKFVPLWLSSDKQEEDDTAVEDRKSAAAELLEELGRSKARKPMSTMSFPRWSAAFDQYAVAAAVTKQWSYVASFTHKAVVGKLASEKERPVGVAVIYDELVRQRIATRVASKAPGFSQDTPVTEVDRNMLERAQAVYKDRADTPGHSYGARWSGQAAAPKQQGGGSSSSGWGAPQKQWGKRPQHGAWSNGGKRTKYT